jgi:hypothetical protein
MRLSRVAKKLHRVFAFYLQHCRIEEAVACRVRMLSTLRGACAQWRIVLDRPARVVSADSGGVHALLTSSA